MSADDAYEKILDKLVSTAQQAGTLERALYESEAREQAAKGRVVKLTSELVTANATIAKLQGELGAKSESLGHGGIHAVA